MFDFLKKKKQKEEVVLIEEPKKKVENIKTLLLMNSIVFLNQEKDITNFSSELESITSAITVCEKNIDRLRRAFLVNTQNYKEVEKELNKLRREEIEVKARSIFLERVKTMGELFPGSFLVPFDIFYSLLKKYNLMIGKTTNYTGVIPEKNLLEVEKVKRKLNWLNDFYRIYSNGKHNLEDSIYRSEVNFYSDLGEWKYNREMLLVTEVREVYRDNDKDAKKVRDFIEYNWRNLIPSPCRRKDFRTYISIENYQSSMFANEVFSDLDIKEPGMVVPDGSIISQNDLLIAAPKKYLKNEVTVSSQPVDPIVFQTCPWGVIIHSVWGEEAEDKVLEEYLQINNIIKNI